MRIEEAEIHGWPGFVLAGERVRVGVVPCPGGRIASLCHDDEELLFVQPEHRGARADLSGDLRARKAELGFRVWGGNKTWVAPQHLWLDNIPPLDLDAGEYQARVENDAIELTSPVCRETGVEIMRRVRLEDDDALVIEHAFANSGSNHGVWDVTQWLRPFDVYFAGDARAYPEEGTSDEIMRSHVSRVAGWSRVAAREAVQFKVGARTPHGEMIALRSSDEETLVVRYQFDTDPHARYAHDASVEVFNSDDYPYLEVEVHAPLGATTLVERIQLERRPGILGITDVTR